MNISKDKWEKIAAAVAVAITVGIAKKIYRKLSSPANYIFLAVVNFFYSIFVFLLFMSFVAGRIRAIAETFPQFTIFTSSWIVLPFGIISLVFIYIFLIFLLRWYFEKKPLSEVAETFVNSVTRGTKTAKDTVAKGLKTSAAGAKKAVKTTTDGTLFVAKVTNKGVHKAGSVVKKAASALTKKPIQQNPEQDIDSCEDEQE